MNSTIYPNSFSVTADENISWQVLSDYRDLLIGPDGLRLSEWLRDGRAQVIKNAPHRTIYKVELGDFSIYIKHYPLVDARGWFRQLVRPAKAYTEFHRAHELARRGIATFTPLAIGQARTSLHSGESFLISRAIDAAEPLDDFLRTTLPAIPRVRQGLLRKRLAAALARFVVRMHTAGVLHHDFHPGNLLVRITKDDQPEFFLIDLHTVRFRSSLSWTACRNNLAMLNNWFGVRASRTDRLRFWHAYCDARQIGGETLQPPPARAAFRAREARLIERQSRRSIAEIWRDRDRRCLASNRYFQRLRTARVAGHAVADLDASLIERLLDDPDEPFRQPHTRILKNSRSSAVVEISATVDGRPRQLIWKRFNVTTALDPLLSRCRATKALRSWYYGQCLYDRFVPTARPLLVLQRKRCGLDREGWLLTEKIDGAMNLHEFLASLKKLPELRRRHLLRTCIEQLARIVRTLHEHELSHRDLKACNILVSRVDGADGDSGGVKVWLIDLVGVEKYGRLPRPRKVRNLARLHASFHDSQDISRSDKLRFLQIYLQTGLLGSRNWKKWWRAIHTLTLAKIARNRRIGRPLA